jgi:hypothetical protein
MLSQRLQLGGLQVGGPRTIQNESRFRVANNVYQTRDGYMVPRFPNEEELDIKALNANVEHVVAVTRYQGSNFAIAITTSDEYVFFHNGAQIQSVTMSTGFTYAGQLPAQGPQFLENLGCLYIMFPEKGLFRYDGITLSRAGVPTPSAFCLEADPSPTLYLRYIEHHIDFQSNIVNSAIKEEGVVPVANVVQVYTIDSVLTFPAEDRATFANEYDASYFYGAVASIVLGAGTATITTSGNHSVTVGRYILTRVRKIIDVGAGIYTQAVAMKVTATTATTVTFDTSTAKYLDEGYVWRDQGVSHTISTFFGTAGEGATTYGSNYWVSVWCSTTSTGNYVLKSVIPALAEDPVNFDFNISVASPTVPNTDFYEGAFNLAGNMGDIYDVTTVKSVFPWYNGLSPMSFTTYGELGLISYENEVYFSDTTLGGAFEMVNGLSFFVAGSGEEGNVQTVCGNSDFLVVSRQYRNYYLSGNIVTANYRVQEISNLQLGAYSNESSIAVEDKIILFTKQGIWAIYGGGRCTEVSEQVRGLFDNFSNTVSFDEEEFFDIDAYPTYAGDDLDDSWVRLRYDLNRGLLTFLIEGDGSGTALVLNMNNGEFTTWNGLIQDGTPKLKDITFIDGYYYVTNNDGTDVLLNVEDKTTLLVSTEAYPMLLKTTWFTAGQPSLEKKILQMKMWGNIEGTVEMGYSVDWNTSQSSEADDYVNSNADLFSHKNRLPSASALACSVYMNLNCSVFMLEGLELEFSPIQQGVKR